jgi:hypothetical protein
MALSDYTCKTAYKSLNTIILKFLRDGRAFIAQKNSRPGNAKKQRGEKRPTRREKN